MNIDYTYSEKWVWRFIIVMILVLVVYLPYVISKNGSYELFLNQVNQQLVSSGAAIELSSVDALTGVVSISGSVNTVKALESIDLDVSSILYVEECFVFATTENLCKTNQIELGVLREKSYSFEKSFVLPGGKHSTEIVYIYDVRLDGTRLLSLKSDPLTLLWEPAYELRNPNGDVKSIEQIQRGSVSILVSRSPHVAFTLSSEKLEAQKMVSPSERKEFGFYELDEKVPLHTWLLVIPEIKMQEEFCIAIAGDADCFEIEEEQESSQREVAPKVLDIQIREAENVDFDYAMIDLENEQIVLFVYFEYNVEMASISVVQIVDEEDVKIDYNSDLLDDSTSYYFTLDKGHLYQGKLVSESGELLRTFVVDLKTKPYGISFLKLAAGAESAKDSNGKDELGVLDLQWGSTNSTEYDINTRTFIDLDNDNEKSFYVELIADSKSDTKIDLTIEFPERSMLITETIPARNRRNIPIKLEMLEYDRHQFLITVDAAGLKSAPSEFEFEYRSQSVFFYKDNNEFLMIFFSILIFVLLSGIVYRRLQTQKPF